MPLLARISARLRRRRAEVDQVWRDATRDADRVLAEARRTQAEVRAEAFERILRQAQALRRPAGR